jgi:nucleotide-binding universal stress UspA family protein
VSASPSTPTPTVVVAWTPDEHGVAAIDHGLAQARAAGARLVVVNGSKGDALVDNRYAGSDALATLEARLEASGAEHEVRQVVGTDVGDAVIAIAQELDADLVVVALRRRTPVGKLLMGSVAQRILLEATCPVLAVKAGHPPRA